MSRFDTRIAAALGWSEEQVRGFSLAALRDLLPASKLRHELTLHLQSPAVVLGEKYATEQAARRVQRELMGRAFGDEVDRARRMVERDFLELGRRK